MEGSDRIGERGETLVPRWCQQRPRPRPVESTRQRKCEVKDKRVLTTDEHRWTQLHRADTNSNALKGAIESFGNQFSRDSAIGMRLFTRDENASPLICNNSSSFQ
jgi:hypothetical protein